MRVAKVSFGKKSQYSFRPIKPLTASFKTWGDFFEFGYSSIQVNPSLVLEIVERRTMMTRESNGGGGDDASRER